MNGNFSIYSSPSSRAFWFCVLLPIREAYEWKLLRKAYSSKKEQALLPIREAYEWKQSRNLGPLLKR
jgi:hypothetical protein